MKKRIVKCPKCGKIAVYKYSYCPDCCESYEEMNLTDENFIEPIYEKKFYDLKNPQKYEKLAFITPDYGFLLTPKTWGDYEEDAFYKEFRKSGNVLYLEEEEKDNIYFFEDWYLKSKEYGFIYYEFKSLDEVKANSRKKYIRVNDKEEYIEVVMINDKDGILFQQGKGYDGKTVKMYTQFIKRGNTLIVPDSDMDEKYELGDWYLNVCFQGFNYKGIIPKGNYFDVYCETGSLAALEYWYTIEGDLYVFEPDMKTLKPINKGRYVREGNIIRQEMKNNETGKIERDVNFVIDNKYYTNVYVIEDKYDYYNIEASKPLEISNPTTALPTISKEEFFDNYPCPYCNARKIWINKSWEYCASANISMYGECKVCRGIAQEIETEQELKKIAYHGSKPNPYYHATAGSIHYLDNPCPYCNAYQVRYIKWKDKMFSVSFWGRASSKLAARYICDNCKRTWE